ncbi:PREDICTED: probable carboxylesterase 2 [Nelumbo nucifera]|uniref:Alpha/beta hydrolase fold-3 domain-containing protein n=2 Tax=Nelumbo nucifera TaxID=4432 RepID=A0A822YSQ5_NELNU|nr:PREDICTED: probable carboxylesterase 2 [Nelumbo nucifera]DAD34601.1 TPA_asm: hypothetical protein HUJ06_005241 [Nelumbo nucifera]
MESSNREIAYEFPPRSKHNSFPVFIRVYRDGSVDRFVGTDIVPPSLHPVAGVCSKDIVAIPETGVSARLYLPNINPLRKLPLLVYFHGGGFCIETPFSPIYHSFINSLVAEANIVAISVHYRRVPEYPLPIAYDDSWAVLQWVAAHAESRVDDDASESWLRDYVDFDRVFLGGDSAGGNIAHNLALRSGAEELNNGGIKLLGMALIGSYLWGKERIGSEATDPEKYITEETTWLHACPSAKDNDDPRINPVAPGAPSLEGLGCRRVLVLVAGKDGLRDRGWLYHDSLVKSGWNGVVEIMETEEEGHVFHLFNPNCEKAELRIKRLASFLNQV